MMKSFPIFTIFEGGKNLTVVIFSSCFVQTAISSVKVNIAVPNNIRRFLFAFSSCAMTREISGSVTEFFWVDGTDYKVFTHGSFAC